ncbi:hypothetical protein [Nostoc sp.]|uniref:hypothetical protein n=1 Tax=Nostoc sp. TaxID=1180 RepID=UPI002FFA7FEB
MNIIAIGFAFAVAVGVPGAFRRQASRSRSVSPWEKTRHRFSLEKVLQKAIE